MVFLKLPWREYYLKLLKKSRQIALSNLDYISSNTINEVSMSEVSMFRKKREIYNILNNTKLILKFCGNRQKIE